MATISPPRFSPREWLGSLDELLRGERTRRERLSVGQIDLPLSVFIPVAVFLGAIYGFFMGWFAIAERETATAVQQVAASMIKLPALFLLTLLVTFPSLYVFNALVGCRLRFAAALRLLIAAIVINLAIGASLGPILAFFTLSTTSYAFIVLLNVVLLGIAGLIGLGFLLKTLRALAVATAREDIRLRAISEPEPEPLPIQPAPTSADPQAAPPIDPDELARRRAADYARRAAAREREDEAAIAARVNSATAIFWVWLIIYGLVGAQMGWLLRPFIGNPALPFAWFRPRSGNFFQAVITHLQGVLGM